ncbi:hypothetical protein ACO0LV_10100 [Pseudactinotalea sp. Z1739]|uniref:hypothetical protein n=1 Tax=Pseudactinotalea sp. Z1739 TaxID=3413028 RepID=UPI003C7E6E78
MTVLLPEPKLVTTQEGRTLPFEALELDVTAAGEMSREEMQEIAQRRMWNAPWLLAADAGRTLPVRVVPFRAEVEVENPDLFRSQGYILEVHSDHAVIEYGDRQGYVAGLTSLKNLILTQHLTGQADGYQLDCTRIVDYPSIPVRAVSPTFSWYAGYGRIGFDMQLWGYAEWEQYLQQCIDQKINQLNMVMYGYWPFEFEQYPETTFKDIPVEIWNAENDRWLKIDYSHPNIEENFLAEFIELAHKFGVSIFAYVGLNSYNGGYTIAHPEKRMTPPADSGFLNDFDSVCLSDQENIDYILASMRKIAELGFDGFSLEESEEGFWFCECPACTQRWHANAKSAGEAKHAANMWLLNQIYDTVRAVRSDLVLGIRAFRQPPLVKDPEWLEETVASIPDDIVLFWAPALYVPDSEFTKWVEAFGKHRIWGRDSESNSITSTMGRLYRVFTSNIIRYEDEPNEMSIERDIEQHIGSVEHDVHGINGFMFEWYGLFMHQFAHGNYGWGSTMPQEEFFERACALHFGPDLGARVLRVLRSILTIHESQIELYTTPFPFQANIINDGDRPQIQQAIGDHPHLLEQIRDIQEQVAAEPALQHYLPHFTKIENAHRRNRVIYDLVLSALDYEQETDPARKADLLDEVARHNERDFAIAKEMFFDLNPVSQTGVRSCMMPYHEMKRLIHNIKNPDAPDEDIIVSGIEALGWLWLQDDEARNAQV